MSEEKTNKRSKMLFSNFFSKIRAVKHIEIIISVLFIAIILLIYFSGSFGVNNNVTSKNEGLSTNVDSTLIYAKELEQKLEKVLSQIKGAGNVDVLINFESGYEIKIAYTTETLTKKENNVPIEEIKQTPVLVTNNGQTMPIVLQEVLPKAKNIVIVSSGASDTNVKMELIRAVESLLEIPASAIEVFAGN